MRDVTAGSRFELEELIGVYPLADGFVPYNPLDKTNLGRSVADALLLMAPRPLPDPDASRTDGFIGAGVYAIYYIGMHRPFPAYEPIANQNRNHRFEQPIYVGKAVPRGARKAGIGLGLNPGYALYDRLKEHAESIDQAINLDLEDFMCRFLVVDDIWIPLGESLFIRETRPLWNLVVEGFGNHDPGTRRAAQQRSLWDVLHPGRPWVEKLSPNPRSVESIEQQIAQYLSGANAGAKTVEEAILDEDV